jgi:hypothetical protein
MSVYKLSIFACLGVLLVGVAALAGCRRDETATETEAVGVPSSAENDRGSSPASAVISLSPRVTMQSDGRSEPKPVLKIEMLGSSGEQKALDIPVEGLKDIGSQVRFSVEFGTPVPGGASGTTSSP